MRLRSDMDLEAWQPQAIDHAGGFLSALFSGGDSRIAADPRTGLNKYLCPTKPAPHLICASSCTASPVSTSGLERAEAAFSDIATAASPQQRADRLVALTDRIEARLLRYFGVAALAQAFLYPSGTDALLAAAMRIAGEHPNKAITAILPLASETGTGVPLAATGRLFDGPESGTPVIEPAGTTVEIPLRTADGTPRPASEVNDAFTAATIAAKGRVVVYLTHGTKTGLIAPVSPPAGADVIVDACQARIATEDVAAYLHRGWPVAVTGSKFFGGPAFSGAVLFPRARLHATGYRPAPNAATLGTALRWTAALATIDAFEPMAATVAKTLADRAAMIQQALASIPALVPITGLQSCGTGWASQPSIFTFGVRDPDHSRRLLSAAELRPLYEHLARNGILFGQPVGLGSFGGLRLAIGARDLLQDHDSHSLSDALAALEEATTLSHQLLA